MVKNIARTLVDEGAVRKMTPLKPGHMLGTLGRPASSKQKNAFTQPISRSDDLAWLAAIVDGEGNLQPTVQQKSCGQTRRQYFEPKIRITNTDVRMIKAVSEIYVREGIGFFYAINSVTRYKNKKSTWRNQLEITVGSKKHIINLLGLIIPHLRNKRRYAELMLETINWVNSQPRRGRHSRGKNYAERSEFWELIQAMVDERAFHIEPSMCTRQAGKVLCWP